MQSAHVVMCLGLFACSNAPAGDKVATEATGTAPAPAADPWGSAPAPSAADPWAAKEGAAVNLPPAQEPAAQPTPVAAAPAGGDMSGHYACQIPQTTYNSYTKMSMVTYAPAGIEFWLDGGRYKTRNESGSITVANRVISFAGGDMNGWTAAINEHSDGSRYIVIRKELRGDPRPGESARFGDYYCGKQSS